MQRRELLGAGAILLTGCLQLEAGDDHEPSETAELDKTTPAFDPIELREEVSLTPRWEFDPSGWVYSTGEYFVDGHNRLSLRNDEGEKVWTSASTHPDWYYITRGIGEQSLADGLYVGSFAARSASEDESQARLFAFESQSGALAWEQSVGKPQGSIPHVAVGDEWVYCTVHSNTGEQDTNPTVHALNANTGEIQWEHTLDGNPPAGLTAHGDRVYVGLTEEVVIYEAATGDSIARLDTGAGFNGFLRSGETLYLCFQELAAYDLANDEFRYRSVLEDLMLHRPVVSDGVICGVTSTHGVVGFDAATGERRWGFHLDSDIGSSLVSGSGLFWISTDAGEIYAINPSDGAGVLRLETDRSTPQIAALNDVVVLEERPVTAYTIQRHS